jgi:hypothetical protein
MPKCCYSALLTIDYIVQYSQIDTVAHVFKKIFTASLFRLLSKFRDTDAIQKMLNAAIRLLSLKKKSLQVLCFVFFQIWRSLTQC